MDVYGASMDFHEGPTERRKENITRPKFHGDPSSFHRASMDLHEPHRASMDLHELHGRPQNWVARRMS